MNTNKAIGLLVLLAFMLGGCGSNSANNSAGDAAASATPSEAQAGAAWPSQLMGKLPEPKGTVTDVSKYLGTKYIASDDTTTQSDMVVVAVEGMGKDNAAAYLQQLKDLGFSGGIESNNGGKIAFSGAINGDLKNAVNFDFNAETGIAHITGSPTSGEK